MYNYVSGPDHMGKQMGMPAYPLVGLWFGAEDKQLSILIYSLVCLYFGAENKQLNTLIYIFQ